MFDRSNVDWLYRVVVRPAVDTDWKALEQLVCELSADHAQFMAICDRDSATVLVGGCDDSQLEKNVILFRSKFLSDVHVEAPQVRYLETIRKAAEVDYSHRKRTGSTGQFARVRILVEPLETDSGFEFENKADNDAIPKQYIPGVEKGIQSVLDRGVIAGFPMTDLKVGLVDGAYHDVHSSVMAFEIASRAAFREAAQKAAPVVIEPILKVKVVTPEQYLGDITSDLKSRRGNILGMESGDATFTINAFVPAGLMFVFSNTLAALTQDRASFSVQFSHYETVPSMPSDDPPPP